MHAPFRYVPELQSFCARELARQARCMMPDERYHFLRQMPQGLRELVQAFPTDFIKWVGDESLLWIDAIQYYVHHPRRRRYITSGFQRDCERGITRRRVLWRPCSNYYCDDQHVLQKIMATPDEVRWALCSECEQLRPPHHVWMRQKCFIEDHPNRIA